MHTNTLSTLLLRVVADTLIAYTHTHALTHTQVNRITVTLRSNVDLPIGGLVTISVLHKACMTSGSMMLHENTDSKWNLSSSAAGHKDVFAAQKGGTGGHGMWDDVEKMLKLHVVVNITAGSYYTFGFNMRTSLVRTQVYVRVCVCLSLSLSFFFVCLSLSHTIQLSLSHSLSLTHSLTLSHSLSLTHSLTYIYIYICTPGLLM